MVYRNYGGDRVIHFCGDTLQELRKETSDIVLCRYSTGTTGGDGLIQFCADSLQELRGEMV